MVHLYVQVDVREPDEYILSGGLPKCVYVTFSAILGGYILNRTILGGVCFNFQKNMGGGYENISSILGVVTCLFQQL